MFYHFILPLQEYVSFLRLFQYITFRSAYAALTALVLVLLLGNLVIRWLRRMKLGVEIRELGRESSLQGRNATWAGFHPRRGAGFDPPVGNFRNHYLIVLAAATLILGILGFVDDYTKSILKNKIGLRTHEAVFSGRHRPRRRPRDLLLYLNREYTTRLFIPFFNEAVLDMSYLWIAFAVIVVVGSSNAVNLTDGLDGLAIGSVISVAVSLGIMTYLSGNVKIAAYLRIPYIPHGAELTVFLSALVGASLGFLWFNSNPASVFMGDTGSLALGGIVGIVAIMIKKEVFLFIVGGVFVVEALSVILQVASYRLRKKRIFKMAPVHHHFELSGWPEQKVVVRMWILGIILAILGLSSLKIL
jgi:phospho-N-acetylmuramoyl-pentapeptide-transferase